MARTLGAKGRTKFQKGMAQVEASLAEIIGGLVDAAKAGDTQAAYRLLDMRTEWLEQEKPNVINNLLTQDIADKPLPSGTTLRRVLEGLRLLESVSAAGPTHFADAMIEKYGATK